ncbi:MAG: hypothetical protein HOP11_02985 [Saprospiraceae bacterium]|nr:hypothetical protein [Saprospiraceae bacterium]
MRADRLFEGYHIWVLAPSIINEDANINYYYDFAQSKKEYSKVFQELNLNWTWQDIRLDNYKVIIQKVKEDADKRKVLVINLCDGDEINQAPGISVVKELEVQKLCYTGSKEYFYDITTSKIPMKKVFDQYKVSTPEWEVIKEDGSNIRGIFERLGTPLIVKPAVSGGSMGLGTINVVKNEEDCSNVLHKINEGYRGWNLTIDGVFAERFIPGREFTTLLVGSYQYPENIIYYSPIERVFNKALPVTEQFLSFDRLWETYEEETSLGEDQFLYNYYPPEPELDEAIKKLSIDTYIALQGTGYTRIDIRMDEINGKLFVLEANAQCGLSEDENYTSIGAILRVNNKSFTELISEIMNDAIIRLAK